MTKLQCVQNAAARIVLNLKKYDFVIPYLMKVHGLLIRQRIINKLNLIVFEALKGDAPRLHSVLAFHKATTKTTTFERQTVYTKRVLMETEKQGISFHVAAHS